MWHEDAPSVIRVFGKVAGQCWLVERNSVSLPTVTHFAPTAAPALHQPLTVTWFQLLYLTSCGLLSRKSDFTIWFSKIYEIHTAFYRLCIVWNFWKDMEDANTWVVGQSVYSEEICFNHKWVQLEVSFLFRGKLLFTTATWTSPSAEGGGESGCAVEQNQPVKCSEAE